MTVGPEDFFKRLEESGLLNDSIMEQKDRLQAVASGEDVAADLVGQRLLTEYQSEVLLSGVDVPMVVGDYVVIDSIGRGGMGYVLKARHRRMKRTVAIKFLLKSLTESDDLRRRFEREVEAAAQLDHQNIVTAYDAGVHEGSHYLVMQYVDGDDLSHIVKSSGPLDIPDAVDVIRQAAMGLGYAHERGIVHRDIKPGNLLLDKEGVVRILDMGLARMTPSPGDELEGGAQADLTNTGSVMGTIDYMAPEQALDAKSVDHRADVYALGCTLYFLLTGNPPFRNDTVMRRLLAHREEPAPRISAYRPEAPPELDDIFATMMAKSPDDRFPSMQHLVVALDSLGLNDSESEPMATLEVPDDGNGGFIKLTDASDASISESVNSPETTLQSDEKSLTGATRKLPVSDETILETSVNVTALDTLVEAESTPQVVTSDTDFTGIGGSHTIAGAAASRAAKSPPPWKVIAPFGLAVVALIAFLMTSHSAIKDEEPSKPGAVAVLPQDDTRPDDQQDPEGSKVQSTDRRAAEAVLGLGGTVWVGSNFQQVVDPAELPTEDFVVTKIDLSEKKNIEDEFLANFRGLAGLQILIFTETSITDRGLAVLTDEGRQPLPALRQLYLDYTKISQRGLQFLGGAHDLSGLMLDKTAMTEVAVLQQFPKLRMLGLGGVSLSTSELQVITRLPHLNHLTMDGRHLTESTGGILAELPNLRALKLRDLPSDFDPDHLARLPLLTELYVNAEDSAVFGDDFWKVIAGLRELHILMCKGVTDESLAKAPPIPQVEVFIVMSRVVTGEAVAMSMSKFPNVASLTVNYSDWTDNDVQQLHGLESLGKIDLTKNSASAEAIKALSAALPKCLIISDHGTFGPSAAAVSPDRRAAEWVLKVRGSCVIRTEGQEQGLAIKKSEAIPDGPFRLIEITLGKSDIPEEEFVSLSGLTSLETASLAESSLTDAALANLRDSRHLKSLSLGDTQVTDDGLAVLDSFPQLKELNLPNGITDKGFVHVLKCTRLEQLGGSFRSIGIPSVNRLPELDQLQTLYIYGVDASPTTTDASRLEVFHQLPKLTVLHLFRSKLPRSVIKGLGQARQIKTLSLFHSLSLRDRVWEPCRIGTAPALGESESCRIRAV